MDILELMREHGYEHSGDYSDKVVKAEQDLAEIKQKYEYNNYVRKEANESNKTLPTIILGVIGVTLGLAKLLSK